MYQKTQPTNEPNPEAMMKNSRTNQPGNILWNVDTIDPTTKHTWPIVSQDFFNPFVGLFKIAIFILYPMNREKDFTYSF